MMSALISGTAEQNLKLFGTDAIDRTPAQTLQVGDLAVDLQNGGVIAVRWRGQEVLRGIDYPIRDANWGTFPITTVSETLSAPSDGASYRRSFKVDRGQINGMFRCELTEGTLLVSLSLHVNERVSVGRAGFVVLHPIAGVAGSPLEVVHQGGSIEDSRFPELISPAQPVRSIVALRQEAMGVRTNITFAGDIFEMEDQRNWTDASFKTYCRPLSLPYPYDLEKGAVVEQSITVRLSGQPGSTGSHAGDPLPVRTVGGGRDIEFGLALEAGWGMGDDDFAGGLLAPSFTLVRTNASDRRDLEQLRSLLAEVRGHLDLEILVSDDPAAIEADLVVVAGILREAGAEPRHITVMPRAYLTSYQPDAVWPKGARPEDALSAARTLFPQARLAAGMLTYFTELNRYRNGILVGDYIAHGTTAIVHAADDRAVMQTLEALPGVYASAHALDPHKPYRLGLSAIAARTNPYGQAVAENPGQSYRTVAHVDPRQRGMFGAAFMVGIAAAAVASRAEAIALAAPAGPFGVLAKGVSNWRRPLFEDDATRRVYPLFHAFRALARGRGWRAVEAGQGLAALTHRHGLVIANLGPTPKVVRLRDATTVRVLDAGSFDAATRDAGWLDTAAAMRTNVLDLGAYAVAFAETETTP